MSEVNIFQRINKVMETVKCVGKNQEIKIGKDTYSVVTHDDVTALLQPQFQKNGIVPMVDIIDFKQDVVNYKRWNNYEKREEDKREYVCTMTVSVTFVNIDNPSDKFSVRSVGVAMDPGDKGPGKALSYAVKYAYLKTLMIKSGDKEEDRSESQDPSTKHITNNPRSSIYDEPKKEVKVSDNPGEYQVKVGKFKGKKVKELKKDEVLNYIQWILGQGKDVTGAMKEFMVNAKSYYAKPEDPQITQDEIPF